MIQKLGILSVVVSIGVMGLGFVAQGTGAGGGVFKRADISSFNILTGPAASVVRPFGGTDGSLSEVRQKTFERLKTAAAKSDNGITHAIIGLDARFTPVGYLSERQVESQSDDIKKAQADLKARLKSGGVAVLHEYEFMPFMLVATDGAGFCRMPLPARHRFRLTIAYCR